MTICNWRPVSLAAVLLLGACAEGDWNIRDLGNLQVPETNLPGTKLQVAQKTAPGDSAFEASLYKEYVELAEAEYQEGDYRDSDVFAERAIRAATQGGVEPEAIAARKLPPDKVGELESARASLAGALAAGAGKVNPAETARAQAMFDCWMQEQEENFQPEDIERCRSGFMTAVAALDRGPKMATPLIPGAHVVLFDFDKAALTPEAKAVLAKVLDEAKDKVEAQIVAYGHADRAGSDDYNDALSKRRVEAVRAFLLESGVEKGRILIEAYGESQPQVSTPDGKAEPLNRRVEVTVTR